MLRCTEQLTKRPGGAGHAPDPALGMVVPVRFQYTIYPALAISSTTLTASIRRRL